jgi:hypothetical protein
LEENGHNLNRVPSRHMPEGTEKTMKSSVRVIGDPAEIRTEHYLNTNLEHYSDTNMLGVLCLKVLNIHRRNSDFGCINDKKR